MLGNSVVGFDSVLFKRELIESPDKVFEAFLGDAITVEDEKDFRKAYFEAMNKIFEKYKVKRVKDIYKGYHFCFQAKDNASQMMFDLIEAVADKISRIDLYCGFYDLKEISVFGESQGK